MTNAVLPQIRPNGALLATEKKAAWWPRAKQLSELEERVQGVSQERAAHHIRRLNQVWVNAAETFLTSYVQPTDVGLGRNDRQRARSPQGIVSAALTQLRDDKVVQDSLPLGEKAMRGLEVHHRDVLSAVEFLLQLDETKDHLSFVEDAFKPAPDLEDA